jgi:hypothetical protein
MKKLIVFAIFLSSALTSCKKDYVCVCTEKATGQKNYGDRLKGNSATLKPFEESCKKNNDVFSTTLENCHIE